MRDGHEFPRGAGPEGLGRGAGAVGKGRGLWGRGGGCGEGAGVCRGGSGGLWGADPRCDQSGGEEHRVWDTCVCVRVCVLCVCL